MVLDAQRAKNPTINVNSTNIFFMSRPSKVIPALENLFDFNYDRVVRVQVPHKPDQMYIYHLST